MTEKEAQESKGNLQAAERESHLLSCLPARLSLCCAKCLLCFLLHLNIRQNSEIGIDCFVGASHPMIYTAHEAVLVMTVARSMAAVQSQQYPLPPGLH